MDAMLDVLCHRLSTNIFSKMTNQEGPTGPRSQTIPEYINNVLVAPLEVLEFFAARDFGEIEKLNNQVFGLN